MDITTTYMGLDIHSPIIVGSSGLTNSVEKIKTYARHGAGAVVLKSIFEEEILFEYEDHIKDVNSQGVFMEQFDYYDFHLRGKKLNGYFDLILATKKAVDIPVIASINCIYSNEWVAFAKRIQDAGADALELNMFFLPSELTRSQQENEKAYLNVVKSVLEAVSIPVSLKISHYFSNLGQMIQNLSRTGISGLVLFNRFFSPDIDIDNFRVKPSFVMSSPAELAISLRWIAIMANKVNCDLAASTGIHDADALIKQLLAGARAVQVVSSIYRNGPEYIAVMIEGLKTWMQKHNFEKIADFRGRMSQETTSNPATYERVQFMRYFGSEQDIA
jgi:dihydroorotate dehydrogenase (fumarate)